MFSYPKKISLIFLPFLILLWQFQFPFSSTQKNSSSLSSIAFAEDDENEYEKDESEDEYEIKSEKKKSKTTKTIDVIKEVTEYKPVTETVVVLEEAYKKDTDGDILVDAIDPDPLVPQSEYFTDTDDDGVPNTLDQYHDEDDFAYYDFESDENNNGIIDSYEQ